ncbi:MAG: EAL domain-containing protein [Burkholderiales bacterium]|nr:EAL domain-containing protein [Burkholderiales bacterium]
MSPSSRFAQLLPVGQRLLLILWPFLGIVTLLVWLSIEGMSTLGAARAYSEGESLWSKGQKEAVFNLLRYAKSRDEADFDRYRRAIAVPLGDRKSRTEMQKPVFDYEIAYQGLREGRTHPDDIPAVIQLFRRFQHIAPITSVIAIWTEGDGYVADLVRYGEELHRQIVSGTASDAEIQATLDRILDTNAKLTPLEDRFTQRLGDATRLLQRILLITIISAALVLVPIGTYLTHRMLRRTESFERALKLSEERFSLAVTGSNDGIWDWNIPANEWYSSPRFREMIGADTDEGWNPLAALFVNPDPSEYPGLSRALQDHLEAGTPFDVELRLPVRSGEHRWFRLRGESVRSADGHPVRMAGSITDITDHKLAQAELFGEKERAQVTLASIGDGVITTDADGWIDYLNPVAEKLVGWSSIDARGLPLQAIFRLVDESTRQQIPNPVERVLREERDVENRAATMLVRNDGAEIPIATSAAPIHDRTGRLTGVVLVVHDVSRERQYAARLSYQASHDALTGLINRTEFERRVHLAVESAAQTGRHHALLYLDLDQFKIVNDTRGHAAGDQLLRQISTLLTRCLREGDTLARLGGDEFGVLLENCPPAAALRIAEKLKATVTDFHFASGPLTFNVGVSIGLVNVEGDLFTVADILSAADTACYMAKDKGRNRIQVFHPDDSELSMRHGEMEWVGRLQKALDEDRLTLYAQDIVGIRTGTSEGRHCEVLIRMIDERGELVPPMAFIPAAERYNLMPAIDRWVIRTAFAVLASPNQRNSREAVHLCAINLSAMSIGDDSFLDFVRQEFERSGVIPEHICFEITETAAIANLDKAAHFMTELKSLGCRFALDDFGAGMSSFAYLKHLPVDFLKIDGTFVKDMAHDPVDRAMVEAINNIGHVMGMRTIAEFVDNDRIIAHLQVLGVDYAQGHGVGRPQPFPAPAAESPRPQAVLV